MRIEPLSLYHPSNSGAGMALQIELRVDVEHDTDGRVLREPLKKGGVFVTWAQQEPGTGAGKNARFLWNDGWVIKFGLSDMANFLSSRERVRLRGLDVVAPKKPLVWERFHRTGAGPEARVSVIRYVFDTTDSGGGTFGLSRGKDERRNIRFTDEEEFLFQLYVTQCVEQFCWVGKR